MQLHSINGNDVTTETVRKKHQMMMDKGDSINIHKLAEILGGSHAILQHYLSQHGQKLNSLFFQLW